MAKQFPCQQCGAKLEFAPGAEALECPYCSATTKIPNSAEDIVEVDFREFLANAEREEESVEVFTSRCNQCGAQSTSAENESSRDCPFCGAGIVQVNQSKKLLKPKSILPFAVRASDARGLFKKWVSGLWFAPNDLKKIARIGTKLAGVYIPYWTFDSSTTSFYVGQRGVAYYTTESYTDSKGNRQTRQVRHIRWSYASGVIYHEFDDVLVNASNSLPREYARKLEPWDLPKLVPFRSEYLSGLKAETYSVTVAQGFDIARHRMAKYIERMVRLDIGGDEQRIQSCKTKHEKISFKHILLPIWISSYRYNKKIYRFLVNGRTGEVQGERPWSWIKISLAVMGVVAIAAAGYYITNK